MVVGLWMDDDGCMHGWVDDGLMNGWMMECE